MKSIEFVMPRSVGGKPVPDSLFSRFGESLTAVFSGFTQRSGKRYKRDPSGKMLEEEVSIYEVAFRGGNFDVVRKCVGPYAVELKDTIETKNDGETIFIGADDVSIADVKPVVSNWPTTFDIAVQTVIGPELHAAQDVFEAVGDANVRSIEGTHHYRGKVVQERGTLSVVICCQGSAGNDAAAMMAERLIHMWRPKAIFLMGICAGRRGKCKIGDVCTPRVIVDDTEGVMEAQRRLRRPQIYPPPHAMIQQLQNARLEPRMPEWSEQLQKLCQQPRPRKAERGQYREHVATIPKHHSAAIYSSDLLLRDGGYLDTQSELLHQQIRIGEMEAAGFGTACSSRSPVIPWFVVRGVSDFGDEFKNDAFHSWAAYSAASFLHLLIRHGINVSLFGT